MCHPLSLVCTFVLVILGLLVLVGTLILLFYYAKGNFTSTQSSRVTFGPGDTQNLFLSPLFCEQLSPSPDASYSDGFEPSTLYLLSTEPTLTGETNIMFQDYFFNRSKQHNFHFYPNSVIAFDVCINSSEFGSFYLIKSQKLYQEWESKPQSKPQSVDSLALRKLCSEGWQNFSYTVKEEDQYYLLFVNSTIMASYDIKRTVYKFDPSTVKASCNFTTTSCSVHVPFKTSAAALLVYGAPLNWGNSWDNVAIDVSCKQRVWLYALLGGIGVLLIGAAAICSCVLCCCCSRCISTEEDEFNRPLLNQHTGSLYIGDQASKEMSNPSRDEYQSVSRSHSRSPTSCTAVHKSNSPHTPPSFKASGKFSLGTPTCETFTS